MIVFKKVEFVLGGLVVACVESCTLPDALEAMKHLDAIKNFKMSIVCYYFDWLGLHCLLLFVHERQPMEVT